MTRSIVLAAVVGFALALPVCTQAADIVVTTDIPFSAAPALRLDRYQPEAVTDDTAVIVYMHRGTFATGDKGSARLFAQAFAESGYIVLAPEYRQYPNAQFPDFVEDTATAVAWTWKEERRSDGSPRPLILTGYGAGTFNAALVALDPRYIAATDAPREAITALLALPGPFDGGRCIDLPCPHIFPEDTRADWNIPSFVGAGAPPMLLIEAGHAQIPELEDVTPTAEAARAAGLDVTEWIAEGRYPKNVLWDACDPGTPTRNVIDAFLARVLLH